METDHGEWGEDGMLWVRVREGERQQDEGERGRGLGSKSILLCCLTAVVLLISALE